MAEFALLEHRLDTGGTDRITEGKRITFFPGKRKDKDGRTYKTGYHYWQFDFRDSDTGKRRRQYGGRIDTCPSQIRVGQYQRRSASFALANGLFRSAAQGVEVGVLGDNDGQVGDPD